MPIDHQYTIESFACLIWAIINLKWKFYRDLNYFPRFEYAN